MAIYKNSKYYILNNDGNLFEIKVLRFVNSSKLSEQVTKSSSEDKPVGSKFNILKDDLEKDYTRLIPDGYINFDIVTLGKNLKDVMVTIIRDKDIREKAQTPFAVCRQCCIDLFAKQTNPENVDVSGISISKDTCPADVDFKNFFACDGIEKQEVIAYYIGDNIEEIFTLLKNKEEYDRVLDKLFHDHVDYICSKNRFLAETYEDRNEVDGYYRTLETLLVGNNFLFDLYSAFNIIPTTFFKEELVTSNDTLTDEAVKVLSALTSTNIDKSLVIKYDRDIDLSKIQRKYLLVTDGDFNVYVVAYTEAGNYHNPMKFETRENLAKLQTKFDSESLGLAMNRLMFVTAKYSK